MAKHHKIGLATVCLHIIAAVYVMGGLLVIYFFVYYGENDLRPGLLLQLRLETVFASLVCFGLAALVEFVIHGLRRRKFWAWVAGLCIFGLFLPTYFFPLGALGLWGLLDNGSRAEFGVQKKS